LSSHEWIGLEHASEVGGALERLVEYARKPKAWQGDKA